MEHEIYWSDLTPEAQNRLSSLNNGNVELTPLAIIITDDDDEVHPDAQECIDNGTHLNSCDCDGFCNNCGHQ